MTNLPLSDDSPEMQAWYAEIHAVADGILRWFAQNPPVQAMICYMIDIGREVCNHNIEAGVEIICDAENLLWKLMDAGNWLGEDSQHGDVWMCAFHEATGRVRQ